MRPTLAAEIAAASRLDQARFVTEGACRAIRHARQSKREATDEQKLRLLEALYAEADAETAWLEARQKDTET